jgi:hypothetical protein
MTGMTLAFWRAEDQCSGGRGDGAAGHLPATCEAAPSATTSISSSGAATISSFLSVTSTEHTLSGNLGESQTAPRMVASIYMGAHKLSGTVGKSQ